MEHIFEKNEEEFLGKMEDIYQETVEAYGDCFQRQELIKYKIYCFEYLRVVFKYNKRKSPSSWRSNVLINDLASIAQTGEIYYMISDDKRRFGPVLKEFMSQYPKLALDQIVFSGMLLEYYYRVYEKEGKPEWYSRSVQRALKKLLDVKAEKINEQIKLFSDPTNRFPIKIKKLLDEQMTGQETAKKAFAMAIHRFYHYDDRTPILLEGPTGVGKTFMFEILADSGLKEKITFFSYTATQLTPNGYTGDNLEDLFKGYNRVKTRRTLENMLNGSKGIILIDEIDKLLSYKNTDAAGENTNETVIHQMLTAVSGTNIAGTDTGDILFIFAGAFENMEIQRTKKKSQNIMGFSAVTDTHVEESSVINSYDLRKELVEIGASRQFLARIGTFIRLERLEKSEIKKILINETNGVFPLKRKQLEKDGLELVVSEAVIDKMVELIESNDMGVRGAKEIVSSIIDHYTFDMIESGYSKMILHEGVFRGEKPYFEPFIKEGNDENFIRVCRKL
jgi:ATP-dependent protease Clp ATPase subunit